MKLKFEARDYGYTVIARIEKILRDKCVEKLGIITDELDVIVPKGVLIAARKRESEIVDFEALMENIDFIHIKEILLYKNNYSYVMDITKLSKSVFEELMQSLYELRIKIAHIRSYFTNTDLNNLIDETKKINHGMTEPDAGLDEFIENLLEAPQELVTKVPIEFYEDEYTEKIINNLPIADYEYEGGFVGRADDEEKIIKMLKSNMHRVITIAGAGGVGKSALTLKIVNDIILDNIIEYDFIVWVSAKENKLSYLGIEDLEPTLKNYDELLDTILNVVGFDADSYGEDNNKKESDINDLFDACNRVLLIIDNLETITDERIINFILDSHPNVNFIITSRRGLGQVERRYDLKELKEKDAIHLFRIICKEKGLQELQIADESLIRSYVKKVYCYPLAIKWVLGQAALGKDIMCVIDGINEQSSDISKFCFDQVFSELSLEAKSILYALCLDNEAVPKGVLKYISNLDDISFEDCIHDLLIVSLILPEQKVNKQNGEINSYYSLLPLTRGYVKVELDKNRDIKSQLQERMVTVETTLEEAERAKVQYRFSLSNFGATTEEEKIASMLAQTAYQKYQAGSYLDAVETFKKAVDIAPRFASIYRNWAIIESMESHWAEADALMEKASKLNKDDTQIWLVWGNIKRKSDKIKEAYNYYEKAYKLSPKDNVVLNSYAQAISRLGDFQRADKLYKEALELVEGIPHNKHLIINYTSIAENLKKWAEALVEDRDYAQATQKIHNALVAIQKVLKIDRNDYKAKELHMDILYTYGTVYDKQKDYENALSILKELVELPFSRYREIEYHNRGVLLIINIYFTIDKYDEARKFLEKEERNLRRISKGAIADRYKRICEKLDKEKNRKKGRIIRYNAEKKFVIIESESSPGLTYLTFLNAFKEYIHLSDDILGREVTFVGVEESGKRHAQHVCFVVEEK